MPNEEERMDDVMEARTPGGRTVREVVTAYEEEAMRLQRLVAAKDAQLDAMHRRFDDQEHDLAALQRRVAGGPVDAMIWKWVALVSLGLGLIGWVTAVGFLVGWVH